jgi:hypothetical protein
LLLPWAWSSTHNHEVVCHNITAYISPPHLLLTGDVDIAKRTTEREPYFEICCEHCILTNCINISQRLDQKRILIVKQPAFVMFPVHVNNTWYDNPGMQALLEIEKALIRKERVVGPLLWGYWH